MSVTAAKKRTDVATHLLQSSPDTVHWGFFDGALKPVLTVDSGDRVVIECVSGNPDWMPPKSKGFEILPELLEIHQKSKKGTGNHILTGPIFVNGAAVGDVLEVRIHEIELRQNWGFNLFRAYMGTIPEDFPYSRLIHVALDKNSNMATLPSGLKVPLRPFFGQLAVAPPKDLAARTARSRASSAAISIARNSSPAAPSICRCGTRARCSRPATVTPPRATAKSTAPRSKPRSRAHSSFTCARI